jgi:hypothetical protein
MSLAFSEHNVLDVLWLVTMAALQPVRCPELVFVCVCVSHESDAGCAFHCWPIILCSAGRF